MTTITQSTPSSKKSDVMLLMQYHPPMLSITGKPFLIEKADKKLIALIEKYHVDEVKAVSVQDVKNAFKPVKKYFKELVFSKKVTQADFDLVAPFFTNARHQGLLIQFPRFTRDKEWIAAFFKDYDDLCDSDLYEFRSLKLACDFILSKSADISAPDYAHAKPHRTKIYSTL